MTIGDRMFHLASTEFPTTATQFAQALASTLQQLFVIPPGRDPVLLHGQFPELDQVWVNLNQAAVRTGQTIPKPVGTGQVQPGPRVRQLTIEARPLSIEEATLNLSLAATEVQLNFDRDADGRPLMLLDQARDGQVHAEISRADIQSILLAGAKAKAEALGLAIQDVQLSLSQIDPRSVGIDVRISAKKFVAAVIGVSGRLLIDDQLNARLRDLSCQGDGMLGKLVCGVLTPHLQKLEGRELSLMALSLGQVRLREVQIDTSQGLNISARFGS